MENSFMTIILSSRLRDILIKIHDDISMFLISLENNNDYTYQFSFLDITEEEGTISFLQTNKFNELPQERGNGDLAWSCKARNEIRIGRLINKITPFYKQFQIEKWVNSFKAEFKNALKNIKFQVIESEDIIKYYNGKRYSRGNGSLNKSCMRHDQCAEWMNLYLNNSDKIKMLILLEEKDIIGGRALLWKLDEPKDTWLLDRIYVKEDSDAILFKKFAERNGWLYKSAQTFDAVKVIKNGEDINLDMRVNITGNYKSFPYIDTLLYFNKKDKYLTNIEKDYETISDIVKLRETNGLDSGNENFVMDIINEELIPIVDSCFCFYGDGYTHRNNAFYIKEFDEYVFPTELRYSIYHKRFLNFSSSVYSKNLGSFFMNSEVTKVYFSKDKKIYDYYLNNGLGKIFNHMNGNFYSMDLLIKGIDDEYYFKDEYDEKSVLEQKESQRLILDNLIKSSARIRDLMGIEQKVDKKKRRKIIGGFHGGLE